MHPQHALAASRGHPACGDPTVADPPSAPSAVAHAFLEAPRPGLLGGAVDALLVVSERCRYREGAAISFGLSPVVPDGMK